MEWATDKQKTFIRSLLLKQFTKKQLENKMIRVSFEDNILERNTTNNKALITIYKEEAKWLINALLNGAKVELV